jgi:soluble lytic murein transglycosylase
VPQPNVNGVRNRERPRHRLGLGRWRSQSKREVSEHRGERQGGPLGRDAPDAATSSLPSPELAAVKVAIALARRGELVQASDVEEGIGDPVARQVVEWAILRSDKNEIDFRR